MRLSFILAFMLSFTALPQNTVSAQDNYAERFDTAWRLVNERHWDVTKLPVDWDEMREKYEEDALAAKDDAAFFAIVEKMYDEVGDNHSTFVPPHKVAEIRSSYGDLPCLGVFSQSDKQNLGDIEFELLENNIGYINLPDLASTNVAINLRSAVQGLNAEGATSFILDLRGNPGGRLIEMMQVAGVFTRGFLWRTITRWALPIPYPAVGNIETDAPLIILIDGGVNSAAEGLAGALQKKGRATIIGETSAGNVEAVLPFCLRDGSQAWVATGVLAPIGGPTWEGVGVVPDIEVKAKDALEKAIEVLSDGQ
ncbi:MAG: S41 family peptidase [Trueperaceae bacterium]